MPMLIRVVLIVSVLSVLRTDSAQDSDGFKSIFDGQSLAGWETPDPSYWSVEQGAIVGRITREHPCTVNQYLVWTGGELADFELKLESRLNGEGGINNGFQFRSRLLPDHDICGYQMDNNLQTPWLVRLYEEFGRHTLAMRGERTVFDTKGARETSKIVEASEQPWFRLEEWHEYHLKCVGSQITLRVNNQLAAEAEDNDPRRQALQGILGLQLHSGPPTVVQFKNIRLKILKPATLNASRPMSDWEKNRKAILEKATAWWPLDSGGHGATPALRHVPGWEHFELNRRAGGNGATPEARVVLLDGAYFITPTNFPISGEQMTVFLRARDPNGKWNAALLNKRGTNSGSFRLFGSDLPVAGIYFEARTTGGVVTISFPVSQIDPVAWHDLLGVYDGKNLSLFCDGRLMAAKPCHGVMANTTEPLLIGAESQDGKIVGQFRGELEEAAIWSSALSAQEIRLISHSR